MSAANQTSKFGLFSIVMLGMNAVIGSGIFLLPSIPMNILGPSSIFIFPLVSLFAATIALCFAECAGRFQKNGAAYLYAKEAFGEFIGFEVGLLKLTVNIAGWAAFAVGFISALGQLFPVILEEPFHSIAICIFLTTLIVSQLSGVYFIKILNNIMTIGKLIPIVLFIILGVFYLKGAHFVPLFPESIEVRKVGSAALIVFFAFSGFESIALTAEDMKDPKKNLPKALFLVLGVCSLIYLLLQVITIGILGEALSNSPTPLYDAAQIVGTWTGNLMAMGTLISIGGASFAASYVTPRTAVALAQDGLLPAKIAQLNNRNTPACAILICGSITLAIALTGSFEKLVAISVVARLIQFLPTALAVLVFRRRYTEKSSYHIPFGPLVPLLAIGFSLWLVSNANYEELLLGLMALLLGIPLYQLRRKDSAVLSVYPKT
jgi:amino acid transporter